MSALLEPAGQPVDVIPLSAHIGAEIRGVDLTQPLTTPQIAAIRHALLKWRVIFFREQFLTHEQHVAFSAQFGEPTVGHPVFGHVDGHPAVYSIAKHRKATRFEGEPVRRPWTGWHTDVTAAVNPPWASILRGVTIPPYGGDTQWTTISCARTRRCRRRCAASSTACAAFTASRRRPAPARPAPSTKPSSGARS
ncbi:taurine dioxygenase [Burkholderia pseudomultivorans]|uniref:Taurine dioxygenase n=1 Tax=Burkholderia pseudomultivorans TaxID=1207504 RepID=A0A6P2GXC9_9BURK|nr:taurine dioxygenase [Burkholderia pseudomultivorans]